MVQAPNESWTFFCIMIKNLEGEEWKDINGFEGLYKVSNLGRILSLRRKKPRIKALCVDVYGYNVVPLYYHRKRIRFFVHRLVACAFIPNPNGFPQINHKDENKLNNCVSNLEWCNQSYNNAYGSRSERMMLTRSKNNSKVARIPVQRIDVNGNLIGVYKSFSEASDKTGVSRCDIRKSVREGWRTHNSYFISLV